MFFRQDLVFSFLDRSYPIEVFGTVQQYAWGEVGPQSYIAQLLNQSSKNAAPWAEFWLGSHPKSPSFIVFEGHEIYLDQCFKDLPWMMKILSAQNMLSVQLHPNQAQAINGYAGSRFTDKKAKAEMVIPLTEFWAMSGFCTPEEGFNTWKRFFGSSASQSDILDLYTYMLQLDQPSLQRILGPVIKRLQTENQHAPFSKYEKEYWFLQGVEQHCQAPYIDSGLVSIILFNLIQLNPVEGKTIAPEQGQTRIKDTLVFTPGTGLFIDCGIPHFYLKGTCLEQQTNSDNVIRAGLTPKHKDLKTFFELLSPSAFSVSPIYPEISQDLRSAVMRYTCPRLNFKIKLIAQESKTLQKEPSLTSSPKIGLILKGKLVLSWREAKYIFSQGQSFLIPPGINTDALIQADQDSFYIIGSL